MLNKEAFEKLYQKLSGGASNVVMYAPRRYGKTSLVKKVLSRFREEGVAAVYFDLNKVETLEKFCEEYTSAICSVAGKGAQLVDCATRYLAHLHPTFRFGGEMPVAVSFDYGTRMTATSLSAVLDFAEKMAVDEHRAPLIVAFDEFQEIARLSPDLPLEGIFRSCIQAHQNVRYLFFGSRTHLLMRMFNDKAKPFYKSAATMRLEKPPEAESVAFIRERLGSCAIGIEDDVAESIVKESDNIPYYLQQLSSLAFDRVVAAGRDWVEPEDVAAAITDLIAENEDYYVERLRIFSPTQRALLAALAEEPTGAFTEEYRRAHGLGVSSTVHTALKVLVDVGVVESDAKGYYLGDPFFARYIRLPASC